MAEKPAASDRLYLGSVWAAMRVTFGRWWHRPRYTRYPRAGRTTAAPGVPGLNTTTAGDLRCVACWLCVAACPAGCIQLESEPVRGAVGRKVTTFTLALDHCLFCGNCVAACPSAALATGERDPRVSAARAALSLNTEQLRLA